MADVYRKGYVYVQNLFAGIIRETDEGYVFAYDREYLNAEGAVPVSITLPLAEGEYMSTILFPFFDGLIPEGWLLGVVKRNWKIEPDDRFGLLLSVCRDCIGDVCVKDKMEKDVLEWKK